MNTLHDATLIPTSAIQHNGQTAFVYVLEDNTAHMRIIKPGVTDGGTAQVTGINPGDVLANSSFDKLQDNSKVITSDKQAPGSSAAPAASQGNSSQGNPSQGTKSPGKKSRGSKTP
jgi:membrane fusion protein, multidrug efflux system